MPFTVPPHTTHIAANKNDQKEQEKEKEKEKLYRSSESTADFFGRKNLKNFTANTANPAENIQNFQRNTKQFVRQSMDSKFGVGDKSQFQVEVEVPRDGRISCCGKYLVIVGSDGSARLYDCEAAVGMKSISYLCFASLFLSVFVCLHLFSTRIIHYAVNELFVFFHFS